MMPNGMIEGEEYADVTAKDFVTGIKYAADNRRNALHHQDSIKGLNDYVSGKNKDFSAEVKQLMIIPFVTLDLKKSYWNSKLTLGITFSLSTKNS